MDNESVAKSVAVNFALTYKKYLIVSMTDTTHIETLLIDRINNLRDTIIDRNIRDRAAYVNALTEEYAKLTEYHQRFGIIQPESTRPGNRYLP